jgi:hypothetical protein
LEAVIVANLNLNPLCRGTSRISVTLLTSQ